MVGIAELAILFEWIFVIIVIFGLFGLIAVLPFFFVKISEEVAYFFSRRKFIKDLTKALKNSLIENLDNVESIFLISFLGIQDYPFVLNNELQHFIGLITLNYWDTFDKEIDFREIKPNDIRSWRTLIEGIIESNQKRLVTVQIMPHFNKNKRPEARTVSSQTPQQVRPEPAHHSFSPWRYIP